MNAQQRQEVIDHLTANGMPAELAPRAVDALEKLRNASPGVRTRANTSPESTKYFFFQGFVAGYNAAAQSQN